MIAFRSIKTVTLLVCWMMAWPSIAETRIALVIGNGAYESIGALPNPPNDMELMRSTLKSLDFEVLTAVDVDMDGMKTAIQEFGRRLEAAAPDTVALFYYAGHGLQADGINFLVPTDAAIMRETDIAVETINLDWVIDQMEFAGNRMNIVILDACRNNPIVRSMRSGTRGLAQIDAPRGTLIAYATAPGAVAVDGVGRNSPYSAALARNLQIPGLAVEEVFRQTRVDVLDATGGDQVPWEASSLTGAFYFKEGEPSSIAAVDAAAKSAVEPQAHVALQQELVFWQSIKDSDDPALFEDYLARYPHGAYEQIALSRYKALSSTSPSRRAEDVAVIDELDRLMYVQERANFRAEPSAKASIITTLDPGIEVQVNGIVADDSWYRVTLEGDQLAFVWQPLLGLSAPAVDVASLAAIKGSQSPPPLDLTGLWSGQYRCQQDVVGVTIDLLEHDDRSLEGVFSFFPLPGSPSFPEGSYALVGQIDSRRHQVDLKSTDWIDRSFGLQRHDLRGEIGNGETIIAGRVLTTGCTEFTLVRQD